MSNDQDSNPKPETCGSIPSFYSSLGSVPPSTRTSRPNLGEATGKTRFSDKFRRAVLQSIAPEPDARSLTLRLSSSLDLIFNISVSTESPSKTPDRFKHTTRHFLVLESYQLFTREPAPGLANSPPRRFTKEMVLSLPRPWFFGRNRNAMLSQTKSREDFPLYAADAALRLAPEIVRFEFEGPGPLEEPGPYIEVSDIRQNLPTGQQRVNLCFAVAAALADFSLESVKVEGCILTLRLDPNRAGLSEEALREVRYIITAVVAEYCECDLALLSVARTSVPNEYLVELPIPTLA